MATLSSLINYQDDLSKRIFKAQINFTKSPKERINRNYIDNRLEALGEMWTEFKNGHKDIVQENDPMLLKNEAYIINDVYDQTEEVFLDYKCELQNCLSKLPKELGLPKESGDIRNSDTKSSYVKLPEIHIPRFSGRYTEWITFRDLFISMIHNNKALDDVQRLQYLKSYLTGEAEQLIRNTPVTAANYHGCWDVIEQRYNNKKFLVNNILKRFLNQRNATTATASILKEFVDTTTDCLTALMNLGIDVSTWDPIVIHLLCLKLDPETRKEWELHISNTVDSDSLPIVSQLREFLCNRFRALEVIEPIKYFSKQTGFIAHKYAADIQKMVCEFCDEPHKLCFCKKFANLDYVDRHDFVMKNRICFNCLGSNHGVRFCQTPINCRICKKRHHSLLHPKKASTSTVDSEILGQTVAEKAERVNKAIAASSQDHLPIETVNHMAYYCKSQSNCVLLATALVEVKTRTGQYHPVRALLDQGSQASFITEATVQGLGLKRITVTNVVSGLGGQNTSTVSRSMVLLTLKSKIDPKFVISVKAYVLNNITTHIPGKKVYLDNWFELSHLTLADPQFDTPNKIDILLGADVYCQIIKEGVLRAPTGTPVAQCTTLGWIISGPVNKTTDDNNITVLHSCVEEIDLKRFWELESESLLTSKMLTLEEQRCEDIFAATTRRDSDGRYVVKLPFREEVPSCKDGDSREIAVRRFKNLERKFATDSTLKERYTEVIHEYLQLDHMRLVQKPDANKEQAAYLPHHAVIREDKSTTKVRVVFDASCKYKNGISLNDTLMVGPKLQLDLRHLITNWRTYPICIVADIVKMYRMVRVADEDCDYQRIVWRNNTNEEIQDYKLLTVTFGTASAPYLAVKALNQVAIDYKDKYPMAAEKVEKEFYMDDLMSGCQTIEERKELIREMYELLKEGGFTLQKWSSNKEELLRMLEQKDIMSNKVEEEEENRKVEQNIDNVVKILGLTWNRNDDEFQYSVKQLPLSAPVTKRKIISDVARLFDPLGWIAPCVILAKIFIQRLWIAGTGWDEEPPDIINDWYTYRNALTLLTGFRIPRWLFTKSNDVVVELHGFSDASNVAYAAVVYLRVIDKNDDIHVSLVGYLEIWSKVFMGSTYLIHQIRESTLTFGEMSTLLAQIEACLNSRPLTVINNNPGEPIAIEPGHFLIGEPLVTVPEANYDNSQLSSLRRWQVTQAMLQSFWRRWSREYLSQLMHRYKWAYKIPEPAVGDIVLVKEEELPPSRWLFGRVLEKYPGTDGMTRVVLLKCKNSTIKRPTSKLCILPVNE